MTGAEVWSREAVLTTSPATIASDGRGAGSEGHDRLPRVHRDSQLEVEVGRFFVHLGDGVPDGQSRPDSALRVVAVGDRRAEDAHHRIPDELLDGAAVRLELGTQPPVVRVEDRPEILRVRFALPGR